MLLLWQGETSIPMTTVCYLSLTLAFIQALCRLSFLYINISYIKYSSAAFSNKVYCISFVVQGMAYVEMNYSHSG